MPTTATHVWRPSSARLAVLDAFVPVPRGSAIQVPVLTWPAKDPADVLDYQFDFSAALVGNDGDSVASIDVVIQPEAPGDLSLLSVSADGAVAVLWLSLGQVGTSYAVTLSIVTVNGRSIQRVVYLPVLLLSQPATPPGAIRTDTGVALTDENGNPVVVA
jgi:hypothetical protein